MFTGLGIFPAIDLAFNAGLLIVALIAFGITGPEFNFPPIRNERKTKWDGR